MRPQVSIVIFSSGTPISTGQAVYAAAEANQATEPKRQAGIELFSRRTLVHGGRAFAIADVTESARLRLCRARSPFNPTVIASSWLRRCQVSRCTGSRLVRMDSRRAR